MIAPPRTAELILEALGAQPEFRDAVLGDLAEEFALRAERDGISAARLWYYRESIRATPHLLRNWSRHLRARDVSHLAGVILTSYVFVLMPGVVLAMMVRSVMMALGVSSGFQLIHPESPLLPAIGLMLGVLSTMTGGYIAAWLHARAPMVGALALGVVWSCASLSLIAIVGSAPTWYQFGAPLVVVVGTTVGGMLRVSTSRSPTLTSSPPAR
jgi:hypothetical protein